MSGVRGSRDFDDADQPRWDLGTILERVHDYDREDGSYAYSVVIGRRADRKKAVLRVRRVQGGNDWQEAQRAGELCPYPGLGSYRFGAGDDPPRLYRVLELNTEMEARPDDPVCICEGEKDTDTARGWDFIATTNACGALKWNDADSPRFEERDVLILVDNDDNGAARGDKIARSVGPFARSVKLIKLPGLREHGDITDWIGDGHTKEEFLRVIAETPLADLRPVINIRAGELHLMASAAEDALIAAGAPFYNRGGLVQPVIDETQAAHGRRTNVARLSPVYCDTLIDHMSRVGHWRKRDGRRNRDVPADPPQRVAQIVLAREAEWRFRKLVGVTTTPTLRPDGSILAEAGYDEPTRLLLLKPPPLPPIADRPSLDDATEALGLLKNLLSGFPFVDEPSRAVGYSMLITPVCRGALPVAPLHSASAPTAGSGKSYLVDLAAAIAIGDRAPVIAAGRTEEETEKRLAAALISGQPIVSIDNVNGELGGDALCQMVERPVVAVRPLGVSKLVRIEARATCYATGNNIQLVNDMTRRVVVCSLDPQLERPELRAFSTKPFEMILVDRGKYIAAALTIVRAYVVAGCPDELSPLASFEEWSRLVRSALVWLGCADPVKTMETARAEDTNLANLRQLLTCWHDAIGSTARKAGEIKDWVEKDGPYGHKVENDEYRDFSAALLAVAEGHDKRVDAKRLGRYLRAQRGRILDGLRLTSTEDTHNKQNCWQVVPVDRRPSKNLGNLTADEVFQ